MNMAADNDDDGITPKGSALWKPEDKTKHPKTTKDPNKSVKMEVIQLGKRPVEEYTANLKSCPICKKQTKQEFIFVKPNKKFMSKPQLVGLILGGAIGAGVGSIINDHLGPSPNEYDYFLADYCTECKNTFLLPRDVVIPKGGSKTETKEINLFVLHDSKYITEQEYYDEIEEGQKEKLQKEYEESGGNTISKQEIAALEIIKETGTIRGINEGVINKLNTKSYIKIEKGLVSTKCTIQKRGWHILNWVSYRYK
jgi:hypothetical protein